ncbi:MAG: hypothetical protein JWQ72_1716 [Polaromonas sp.]|nr:hypothetical protein [Polaromonas sp.]
MKTNPISRAQLQFLEIPDADKLELCIYQAEADDSWKGFIAASCGWSGRPPLPGIPALSFAIALQRWANDNGGSGRASQFGGL